MENLNYTIDAVIIAILLITMLVGAYRGFINSVFRTFSSIVALILAFALHPVITRFIKITPLFDLLKEHIADKLGLSLEINNATQAEQSQIISSLPLPDFLNKMLIENNNSVVHELLDTHGIADYICSYIANLIISIVVTLILVLCMKFVVRAIIKAFDIIAKLPVIHQLNYLGGGLVGIISGVIIIWLIFLAAMIFVTDTSFALLQEGIDGSILGKLLYDNNIFVNLLMGDLF